MSLFYDVWTQVLELDFLIIIFEKFFFAYFGKCAYFGCAYYEWGLYKGQRAFWYAKLKLFMGHYMTN